MSITFLCASTFFSMICNLCHTKCFFCDHSECPGCDNLENTLEDVFIDYAIENIAFKHWIFIDKYELVTTVKTTEEFIEWLLENCYFIHCNTEGDVPQRVEMWLQSGELWFFVTSLKIILSFCKMKQKECTSHYPSICNLFQEIRCFKCRAWESGNEVWLKSDSILVYTFQWWLIELIEDMR